MSIPYDVGVVHLTRASYERRAMTVTPSDNYAPRTMLVAGYPTDRAPPYTQWRSSCVMGDADPKDAVGSRMVGWLGT
jgi:V8-like Glu-specific endopeptidase